MELDKIKNSFRYASAMINMLKVLVGSKNYYVGLGGAIAGSFFIGLMVNSWFFKILYILNAIGLFLMVVYEQ